MLYFEREVSVCLFQNCKKKLFPQTTERLELAERGSVITDNTLCFECYFDLLVFKANKGV